MGGGARLLLCPQGFAGARQVGGAQRKGRVGGAWGRGQGGVDSEGEEEGCGSGEVNPPLRRV